MDIAESIVEQHLRHRGFTDMVYEPDGNIPPDFLVDGRIAVEVRRLNENERGVIKPIGLDSSETPLLLAVQQWLAAFGPPMERSWWIRLVYKRPFPPMNELRKAVTGWLTAALDSTAFERRVQNLDSYFELELIPRLTPATQTFSLAIMRDDDSGGWLLDELERNLRLCIDEKTRKIADIRSRYPVWWLVFVDQITFGVSEYERTQLHQHFLIDHSWDKVVLVSPLDPTYYFDL